MRLTIHAGTHKTASTFLQHVLVLNQKLLAEHGIYTQPDAMMTGNHGTARMTLLEDYRHVEAHVREAVRQGRRAALLSSEDFETLIFDPRRARLVEDAARSAGATSVEWTFCLRDPGDYFASMMAQLTRLAFVDYRGALAAALRDGRLRVHRERRRYPLYWDFCFDYATHLAAFAKGVEGRITVHDFRHGDPFPGHGVLGSLGIAPTDLRLPGDASRNARPAASEADGNRTAQFKAILAAAGIGEDSITALATGLPVPAELQREAAAAVSRLYGAGTEQLLAQKTVEPARSDA